MTADIAAEGERLRRDYDEALARADQWLGLLHQAQVHADAIRAEAQALRAEHPEHPDLDWLEGDRP